MRARLAYLRYLLLGLFLLPFGSLALYQLYFAEDLNHHKSNLRTRERVEYRGRVLDRHGQVLAGSDEAGRLYPAGPVTAPLVGYWHRDLGRAGVESEFQKVLASPETRPGEQPRSGQDVQLTLDLEWQRRAFELMAPHRGALVILEIASGAARVAVSRPSFPPDRLSESWTQITRDPGAPLIERVAHGLYPSSELREPLTRLTEHSAWGPQVFKELKFGQSVEGFPSSAASIFDPEKPLLSPLSVARVAAALCRGGADRRPVLVEPYQPEQGWLQARWEGDWWYQDLDGSWWVGRFGEHVAVLRLEESGEAASLGISILESLFGKRTGPGH